MTRTIRIMLAVAFLAAVTGCTAVTNFDEPDPGKIVIGEVLDESEMLVVQLDDDLATIALNFEDPLPVNDQEEIYDLVGGIVSILLRKDATSVGVELTGPPTSGTPNAAGEYNVDFTNDDQTMEITFYNETSLGQAMQPGEAYTCVIQVGGENDYFVAGSWIYSVDVRD